MKTVFIIEWSGCECGGVEQVAFRTREAAQEWIAAQPEDAAVDHRCIVEVPLLPDEPQGQ